MLLAEQRLNTVLLVEKEGGALRACNVRNAIRRVFYGLAGDRSRLMNSPDLSPKHEPCGWLGSWRWSGGQGKPGSVTRKPMQVRACTTIALFAHLCTIISQPQDAMFPLRLVCCPWPYGSDWGLKGAPDPPWPVFHHCHSRYGSMCAIIRKIYANKLEGNVLQSHSTHPWK